MNIFPRKKIPVFFWPISFFVFLLPLFSPKAVFGVDNCGAFFSPGLFMSENTLSLSHTSIQDGHIYKIITPSGLHTQLVEENITAEDGRVTITISPDELWNLSLFGKTEVGFQLFLQNGGIVCERTINIAPGGCQWSSSPSKPIIDEPVTITVFSPLWPDGFKHFYIKWTDETGAFHKFIKNQKSGKFTSTAAINYNFYLYKTNFSFLKDDLICTTSVSVGDAETPGEGIEPPSPDLGQYNVCQGNKDCKECFDKGKAWTALGCIPTDSTELIKWAFPYLLGFGGLAAFLLIVFAGIQIMTSSGNPEKLKAGKELITSAVTGLIFIILSLFLLRVIGVDILHIPGLQ